MRKTNIYIAGLLSILVFGGCKKYLDVNHSNSSPVTVPESLILGPEEVDITSLIYGGGTSMLVNAWVQNVSQNQESPNSDNYQVNAASFNSYWTDFYATTMINDVLMENEAAKDGNFEYLGISRVLLAYTLGYATDLWGDIPYSQAFLGNANLTPKYDSQDTIYMDLQNLLDSAIVDLQNTTTGVVPGTDDYFYGGNEAEWIKAAYLLKARFYMHLTKAPGFTASTQAGLALAALQNAMTANSDDMAFPFSGAASAQNPIYQNYGSASYSTVVLSSNYVDSLVNRADPRLAQLVGPAPGTGLDSGRTMGFSGVQTLTAFSNPGPFYGSAGSSGYVLNYTEALFLKAEALLITSGAAAATPVYRLGITTHMAQLGLDTTSAACQAYLAKRGTLTAANAYEWLMEEKDLANAFSMENYTDWRRTGYPTMTLVPNAVLTSIPRRFLYPLSEISSNPQSQQTAALTDRVWWDAQ